MAASPEPSGRREDEDRLKQAADPGQWTPGRHEVEYYQLESDLHDRWNDCRKNPQHGDFIPVSKFTLQYLPEGHRGKLVWDYIQTVISLTVRLRVFYLSKERPDSIAFDGDTDMRGVHWPRVATGRVFRVYRKFTEEDGQTCPCTDCQQFPKNARTKWGGFEVRTASHVVYNSEECKGTKCDVWYDSKEDRSTCPKMEGVQVVSSKLENDICEIYYVTHDEDVYNKLAETLGRYRVLCDKLSSKSLKPESVAMSEVPVLCVSHPHGASKHVTVGMVKGEERDWRGKWSYTTQTCPGSSGAPVFTLGRWDEDWWSGRQSIHSRSKLEGENECGYRGWWEY